MATAVQDAWVNVVFGVDLSKYEKALALAHGSDDRDAGKSNAQLIAVRGRDDNDLEEPPSLPPGALASNGSQPVAQAHAEPKANHSSGQPDPNELARSLTGFVKQMLGVIRQNPSQKATMAKLATDAQASLKRGDLDQAAARIEVLRKALDAATDAGSAGSGGAPDQDQVDALADRTSAGVGDPAKTGMSGPDVPLQMLTSGDDPAVSGTDNGGGPQWETGPSFDPKDDTSEGAADLTVAPKSADQDAASGHVDTLNAMRDGAGTQANEQAGPDSSEQQGAADSNGAALPDSTAAAQAAAPAIAKARQEWIATRQKVEGDLGKMHGAFTSALQGHSMQDELTKTLRSRVDGVLDTLDETLAHTLDGINGVADPAQRAKLVEDAHALIGRYQAHVASDETIALLDDNPFAPLTIQKTMTATLAALSTAIR